MTPSAFPPGPRARFPMDLYIRFRSDRIGFLEEMSAFGDVSHLAFNNMHLYLLNHPDMIRDLLVTNHRMFVKSRALKMAEPLLGKGLLTSEGDYHLRQRRLVQPAFHRQRMAGYAEVMAACAARTADRWQDGQQVNMAQEMMRLTLAIVGQALFDADVEDEAPQIGQALTESLHAVNRLLLPGGPTMEKLPLPVNRRAQEAMDRLNDTIYRMVGERRASGEDRGDLLSMLLEATDEEGDGARMTDEQVRDEAMTLFLAGHETTANALIWTWYLLAQNPVEERQLHRELDRVLAGRTPTIADLPDLPYTRMVLSEVMRLFPPAYVVGRQPTEDYTVRDWVIPAGSTVFASQYVMHRDPRYWYDAERFDPMRWTPEEVAKRPRFSYFPFGAGPRVCIGEGFAWTEGILAIATLAQRWRARLVPGLAVALEPMITLRPKHAVEMTLHRR
ncbi:MAG: cytochrome P450 [Caldilineales bacterium]